MYNVYRNKQYIFILWMKKQELKNAGNAALNFMAD